MHADRAWDGVADAIDVKNGDKIKTIFHIILLFNKYILQCSHTINAMFKKRIHESDYRLFGKCQFRSATSTSTCVCLYTCLKLHRHTPHYSPWWTALRSALRIFRGKKEFNICCGYHCYRHRRQKNVWVERENVCTYSLPWGRSPRKKIQMLTPEREQLDRFSLGGTKGGTMINS